MKFRTINGQQQVSFECPYDSTLGADKWLAVDNLDGMYSLLLCQLRGGRGVNSGAYKVELEKKRRRVLIYIRRALRIAKGRKLPLDVVKQHRFKGCHGKLKGYTIIG